MSWQVELTSKAGKQLRRLPLNIKEIFVSLLKDIESGGPIRGNWPNFSKLKTDQYHCHLKKGQPTFVTCWRLVDKTKKKIEVYYVGTHEKAPY